MTSEDPAAYAAALNDMAQLRLSEARLSSCPHCWQPCSVLCPHATTPTCPCRVVAQLLVSGYEFRMLVTVRLPKPWPSLAPQGKTEEAADLFRQALDVQQQAQVGGAGQAPEAAQEEEDDWETSEPLQSAQVLWALVTCKLPASRLAPRANTLPVLAHCRVGGRRLAGWPSDHP